MNLLRRWWGHLKGQPAENEWAPVEVPGGGRVMVDREMAAYLRSRAPQPSQQSLDAVLRSARSCRIIENGVRSGEPVGKNILWEVRGPSLLSELRRFLTIVDGPAGHCMCYGDTAFEFLDRSGKRIAVLGLHHGKTIRWNAWRDDAALVNGLALLQWLSSHGIQYPLQNYQAAEQQRTAAERAWKIWFAAMPPCLQPFLRDQEQSLGMVIAVPSAPSASAQPSSLHKASTVDDETWARVKQAVGTAYSNPVHRAQTLFAWLGSGSGPWTGFPAYEEVPELLLMEMPIAHLMQALANPRVSDQVLEGAARFLAGWNFQSVRGPELAVLPAGIRQRLLHWSLKSADSDKMQRATNAFGPLNEGSTATSS